MIKTTAIQIEDVKELSRLQELENKWKEDNTGKKFYPLPVNNVVDFAEYSPTFDEMTEEEKDEISYLTGVGQIDRNITLNRNPFDMYNGMNMKDLLEIPEYENLWGERSVDIEYDGTNENFELDFIINQQIIK